MFITTTTTIPPTTTSTTITFKAPQMIIMCSQGCETKPALYSINKAKVAK